VLFNYKPPSKEMFVCKIALRLDFNIASLLEFQCHLRFLETLRSLLKEISVKIFIDTKISINSMIPFEHDQQNPHRQIYRK
jgi:hypothetical protein